MKRQREDIQVRQGALNFVRNSTTGGEHHAAFFAKVTAVYSDRMTCDIETPDGAVIQNVPVLTKGGLIDGKPYGERCLPAIDDYVIVMFGSYGQRHKVIVGTVIPYLTNEFTKDAVKADNKAFTKKLLATDLPLEFVRIFKSGTTVQILEDGGIIVETPSGQNIQIDEANAKIVVSDSQGTPNVITFDNTGIVITDTNNNNITMASGKVTINGNLEVLQ